MLSRISKKTLSVVLAFAVLISAICSCIIGVNAVAAGNVYSVVTDSVASSTKKTTVTVTITNPVGITNGSFDLMFDKSIIDDANFDADGNYITPVNETIEEFRARDKDGNFMINGTNVYKQVEQPVYDANGNQTGTKLVTVIDTEATNAKRENVGNKSILLPNAYDDKVHLYDTKIEITGGTKADGTAFDIADFTNDGYETFAKVEGVNTKYAMSGEQTIDGTNYKYIYNLTDDYKQTHYNSNPVNYVDVVEGETTASRAVQDNNLLDKYYREYTTVDVATANLGYKISTVSEDSGLSGCHAYAQFAQGFKDITFASRTPYTSITFTVTLDFSGVSDRIGANAGVDADQLTGTTTVEGNTVNYRIGDGHWATENYIQYGYKYKMNLVNATGDISGTSAVSGNDATNYFHTHSATLEESVGKADPVNKAAIDALKAKNPNAKEGVDYFEIYNAKCRECGKISPMIAAPDLPYKVTVQNNQGVNVQVAATDTKGTFGYNNFRNISGVSMTYNDDGSLALNLHYPSKMDGEQMFITDENGMVMKYSDTLDYADERNSIYTAVPSHFASKKMTETYVENEEEKTREIGRYEGALMSTTHMITVEGFSAADVDKTLYVARYTPSSSTETQLMGITHAISIADYCNEVIKGKNVYYTGEYSETATDADKALAAALMNYANAAKTALANKTVTPSKVIPTEIDLIEFGQYLKDMGSTSTYYDTVLADNGETGADWDNAIIIDSAEEFVYLAKASGNDTKGKYYKVADNIKGFDLSKGNLNLDGTLEENLDKIKASGKNHSGNKPGFQGNFDGNGVTVYGAWTSHNSVSNYAGLFSCTYGDVTIKNVNVKLASFTATYAAGGIIGYHNADDLCTVTIENCSVTESHLETTGTAYACATGGIIGWGNSAPALRESNDKKDYNGDGDMTDTIYRNVNYNIKNCYVDLDENYFISKAEDGTQASGERALHGGIAGGCASNALSVSNCVVMGIKPYATSESTSSNDVQHSGLASHFANVYTTDDVAITNVKIGGTLAAQNYTGKVIPLTAAQMTGDAAKTNMSGLDWETTWYVADDGSIGIYAPYEVPVIEKIACYTGSKTTIESVAPTSGSGTKNNPYIISTVQELAWVVGRPNANIADTQGKYFKVADNIKAFVLQKPEYAEAIMSLNSAAETKAYFEANASKMVKWQNYGWENTTFAGNIDFNGATVYGLYQPNSGNNAGLFASIDAGTVISNLSIKNSYMKSMAAEKNYQVGAIAAVTNSSGYGAKTIGVIWINGCTVANNYMYGNAEPTTAEKGGNSRSGVLVGAASDTLYVDNCLVYGNDATYNDGAIMPLYSGAGNSTPSSVAVPEGLKVFYNGVDKNGNQLHCNMVRNSVVLGALPYDNTQDAGSRFCQPVCYENVYTDAPVGKVEFTNNTSHTYTLAQLTNIDANDIIGHSAKAAMPNLDWYDVETNPDGVWHYSYLNNMPALSQATESPSDIFVGYDDIALSWEDDVRLNEEFHQNGTMAFGVYKTALSLKAKPYMSFAFAFLGEYQTNRDKIQIRFTYTANGVQTTTEPISPPAATYTDGDPKGKPDDIVNVNGWTNKKANGRYHTYTATELPAEAMLNGITVEMNYNNEGWKTYGTFDIGGLGYQFVQNNKTTPCDYYETRIEAAKALSYYIQALTVRNAIQ